MNKNCITQTINVKDFSTELEIKLEIKTNVGGVTEILEKVQENIYNTFELSETEIFPTLTIKKINGKAIKNDN